MKRECPDCLKAAQRGWKSYAQDCPECDIRKLAYASKEEREKSLDLIRRECGGQAVRAVRQRLEQYFAQQRGRQQ